MNSHHEPRPRPGRSRRLPFGIAPRRRPRPMLGVEGLEGRTVLSTATWTGAFDGLWSRAANWSGNAIPQNGDDLVFPSGANQLATTNDLSGLSVASIDIQGAGYGIDGNAVTLAGNLTASYAAGSSTVGLDVALGATETVDVAAGATLDLGGSLSGAGSGLVKAGGGQLTLSGASANTYTGDTTVLSGLLALSKASGTDAFGGNLAVGDGSGGQSVRFDSSNQVPDASSVTVLDGATVDFNANSDQFANLTLQGAAVEVNGGTVSVLTSFNVNTSANHVLSTIDGPGSFDLASNNVTFNVADDPNLAVDARISAVIQDGGIIKDGAGNIALSGDNTYGGDTTVNAGIIQVESNRALGLGYLDSNVTNIAPGAAVYFSGNGLVCDEYFLNVDGHGPNGEGAIYAASGSSTLVGYMTVAQSTADAARLGAADGATLEVDSSIDDGTPTLDLEVNGSQTGRVVLAGDNRFDGNIRVLGGYLGAASDNALGDPTSLSNVTLPDASTLVVSGGVVIPSAKTLIVQLNGVQETQPKIINQSGDNTLDSPIIFQGNTEITPAAGTTLTINGAIGQNLSGRRLISDGQGRLVLTANNAYSGTTFVTAGVLEVDGSIASSSDVQVYGGTLSGTGTMPAVAVYTNGTIAPGASTGILTTGNVAFNSGSAFAVDIDGTTAGAGYDQLNVAGTVSLGDAALNVSLGYTTTYGDTYTILNNDGVDPITGTFTGLPEGSVFLVGNQQFQISYVGGDGNDVTLTALARIDTWSGLGATTNWSDGGNWIGGVAPTPGDNLTFPAGAQHLGNTNDFAPGTAFGSITINASGYFISGNPISLSGGLAAGYGLGSSVFGLTIDLAADQSINVAPGGELDVTGGVSGAHALSKDGGGSLVFALGATYTGGTSINDGAVSIFNGGALGSGLLTINNSGQLVLNGNLAVPNAIRDTSTGTALSVPSGSSTLTGAIDLAQNARFDVSGTLRITGAITESNPTRSLTKTGSGTLEIDSASLYSGGTDIQSGTLTVANSQALGTSGLIYVESGSTLLIASPTFSAPTGGIYLGGSTIHSRIAGTDGQPHALNGALHLIGNADFDALNGSELDVAGTIDGTGTVSLSAASDGRLVLSGTSSYTGKTFVLGGTMEVDGNFTSSGEVDVLGGTLSGSGTVGNVVATGGVVSPGASPGTLTVGSIDLEPGATFRGVLNAPTPGSGYSVLVASQPITANGATLDFVTGYTPALGDTFKIIDNTGPNAISGTFNGLGEGALYSSGGQYYQVSYVGGDGNDVTLTCVLATTTTLAVDAPSPVLGQGVTFSAEVQSYLGTPTGTVTFKDNGVPLPLGTVALANVSGHQVATYTTSALGVGPHSITADYGGAAYYVPSSGTLAPDPLIVSAASTTTSLATDNATPTYGQSVLLTALVQAASPGSGLPMGYVAFYDGDPMASGTLLAVVPMNGQGIAAFSTSALSAASHQIFAAFEPTTGDYLASSNAGNPVAEAVGKAHLTVMADNQSRLYGDANPALTYTISGFANGENLATSGVVGAPMISTPAVATSPVSPSLYDIAIGQGSLIANNYDFSFIDGGLAVTSAPLTITANDASKVFGQAVPTLTATYSGFKNGETPLDLTAPATLSTTATANSPVIGSPYAITASGASSSNYAISYVDGQLTEAQSGTTATLSAPGAAVLGEPIVLSVQVAPVAPGAGVPTGVATFYDGATFLGAAPLSGNSASITVSDLTVGSHAIRAVYGGDSAFAGSQAAASSLAVGQGGTTLSLVSPSQAVAGQTVQLVANVATVGPAVGAAGGTVRFFDGGRPIGSAPIVHGAAVLSVPLSEVGPHVLTATYDGDASFAGSIAPASALSVGLASARVGLSLDTASAVTGQALTLTATVDAAAPSGATPTGTVTFYDNGLKLGEAPIVGGRASLVVAAGMAGTPQAITAVYSGDAHFQVQASNAASEAVRPAATGTTLAASAPSLATSAVKVGLRKVKVTASVIPVSPGAGVPTGQVVFTLNGKRFRTATLDGGSASINLGARLARSRSLTASYSGSSDFQASGSGPMRVSNAFARAFSRVVAKAHAGFGGHA